MNENNFMRVEDVAKELGISISHSYKVMQQLNKELKAKGYGIIYENKAKHSGRRVTLTYTTK